MTRNSDFAIVIAGSSAKEKLIVTNEPQERVKLKEEGHYLFTIVAVSPQGW